MTNDKAMSLVGPINKAFNDLKASYRTSLTHALNLGGLLLTAHEAVGKKGWKAHLAANHPQISYRTATVYIQLAKHREKFDDPSKVQHAALLGTEGDLSIRGAIAAVNKADGDEEEEEEEDEEEEESDSDGGSGSAVSPDLTTLMKNCGADEIKKAMKQAEVYDEVMTAPLVEQIKVTPLSVLVKVLTEAYDPDRLQSLVKDLSASLAKLQEPQAPAASTPAVSSIRRPLSSQPAPTSPTP